MADWVEREFRITTDGEWFRIEKRELTFGWWRMKWSDWEFWNIGMYRTLDEAKADLVELQSREDRRRHGWQPVEVGQALYGRLTQEE